MSKKTTTEFKFDKRQQKLFLIHTTIEDDKKTGKQMTRVINEEHNRQSAIDLKMSMFKQINGTQKFMENYDRLKGLFENRESLPMYKEVKDVLDAFAFNNAQLQQQYMQVKPDYDSMVDDFKKLDKVLPNFKDLKPSPSAKDLLDENEVAEEDKEVKGEVAPAAT